MNSLKSQFVAALVGLYPRRWKREYGAEFTDVLMSRPLHLSTVLDLLWNALGQQLRWGEPWLILGYPLLLFNLATILWNILFPVAYIADSFSGGPFTQFIAWLLPLAIGYWTLVRDPVKGHGGRAAMKNSLLITWPLCAIGILCGVGILRIIVLGPGDAPSTFHDHGFAYTVYDSMRRPMHWQPILCLPFLQLPFAGLLGWLGGLAARAQARFRRNQAS